MNKQEKTKVRNICVDDDSVAVAFRFDEQFGVWLGEYPFFKEEPRYTPSGRPWRNVAFTDCPHHPNPEYNDCGTCEHFRKADSKDMIGVCFHEANRRVAMGRTEEAL